MSEGRPRVGACACLVEGLQRSMSLDRVGSARTLMSGYAMVRFSASIPLSSSASAMTTAQVWTAGPQQQTQGRAVGFVRDVFHGSVGGFRARFRASRSRWSHPGSRHEAFARPTSPKLGCPSVAHGVRERRSSVALDTGSARQGALAGQSELSAALQGRRRARPVGGAVGRVRADRVHRQGGAGAELRDEAWRLGRSARAAQACRHRDARQPRATVEAAAVGV